LKTSLFGLSLAPAAASLDQEVELLMIWECSEGQIEHHFGGAENCGLFVTACTSKMFAETDDILDAIMIQVSMDDNDAKTSVSRHSHAPFKLGRC
jgi:hypothetical protein